MRPPRQGNNRQKPVDPIADSVIYNHQIHHKVVRLIDDQGKNAGEIATYVAQRQANELGLDLVLVAPDANPPVAKIMDAKKHIYDLRQAKKLSDKTARQNAIHVKEIQLRPVIDEHDLGVKKSHAQKFLQERNKVKVVMKFRGREVHHAHRGLQVIQQFINELSDCKVEKAPELQGHHITAMLTPTKTLST
jgi:translation initiation factor IF-3